MKKKLITLVLLVLFLFNGILPVYANDMISQSEITFNNSYIPNQVTTPSGEDSLQKVTKPSGRNSLPSTNELLNNKYSYLGIFLLVITLLCVIQKYSRKEREKNEKN